MQSSLFLQHSGVEHPIICGPMYPCSNPELVAAASEAGALGVIQPIALSYVHGYSLREGIRYMRQLTQNPLAMNLLIEKSSRRYQNKMREWLDIALQEGIRFYITSLGKPDWVVERVHQAGGYVYHDVTLPKWAEIAVEHQVDGLIAVNQNAGGHAGSRQLAQLYADLQGYQLPLVAAGGISSAAGFAEAMQLGYQAVQMGTRFIASRECSASDAYKQAIIAAHAEDIQLTRKITGVPVSVIANDYVKRQGGELNALQRFALQSPSLKHITRLLLSLKSLHRFKRSLFATTGKREYWQAGKSVEQIDSVLTVEEIIQSIICR